MNKGRIMAFDYGMKRTGIAVSDENQIFSFPLETASTTKVIDIISDYIEKEKVVLFVVGLPLCADNSNAEIEPHIGGFIKKLNTKFPNIPVERQDERYTSKMAFETLIKGGVPKMKRRNKSLLDKISASIILKNYLESKSNI